MKLKLNRARIAYEGKLKTPNFGLAENSAASVKRIHEKFAEAFPISASNLHLKTGTSLGEYALGLTLFSGAGLIEFKFDSYGATFDNLSDQQDIGIILECIRLLEAVQSDMTEGGTSYVSAAISAWYVCDEGAEAVSKKLNTFKPSSLPIEAGYAGASAVSFVVNGSLSNTDERWVHSFSLEPSVNLQLGDLYMNLNGRYGEGGRYTSLDERYAHTDHIGTSILNAAGFAFED
jgi:hypothetical protein